MSTVLKILAGIVLVVILLALGGAAPLFLGSHVGPLGFRSGGLGSRMFAFGPGWGLVILALLIRVLFWMVIIAALAWFVSALVRGAQPATNVATRETPLDILKARYARGEITKEQYDQLRHDLEA